MFESVQRKAAGFMPAAPRVPASVPVGRAGDPHERRTDSLAAQAMRSAPLRRYSAPLETASAHGVTAGQPLDPSTRSYFEPRFGDLSGVRVHSDGFARTSAAMINARAFTLGSDIFYGAGEHPGADRLTAHELAHVVDNNRSGGPPILRRSPGGGPFEISSPIWNVGGRPVVIVRTSDGRSLFFYRRSGKGFKGAFEGLGVPKDKWAPFEGFQEVVEEGKPSYRFHKEPYYYSPDVEAGHVKPGYGTKNHQTVAEWLDDTIPLTEEGQRTSWRTVQKEFDKVRAPPAAAGGEVTATSEEITQRIVKQNPAAEEATAESTTKSSAAPEAAAESAPKPTTAPEAPTGGVGVPEAPVPKGGFRATLSNIKTGFGEGLKGAFNPEGIAAEIPFVVLFFADRAAVRDALRNIQVKFAKEGFARGYAAGVAGWSESEVHSGLKNRVTEFRVKGLGDAAGRLSLPRILQLAEAIENYAVDLGFARSSRLGSRWKTRTLEWAYNRLDKRGYSFSRDERVKYTDNFIDKLAWVLAPTTNQIVEAGIKWGG